MKASIIIPCSLSPRKHAAADGESKLVRAVHSALNQDYGDIEVIVIADGCKRTWDVMAETFGDNQDLIGKLRVHHIAKQQPFSGNVRNAGLEAATGDLICYLDADDYLGGDHVSTIVKQFTGDWVWFNDMTLQGGEFKERDCSLKLGLCGTSNIAHLKSMNARWKPVNAYSKDDWSFIQELIKEYPHGVKIETPAYVVCHIPYRRGYDV